MQHAQTICVFTYFVYKLTEEIIFHKNTHKGKIFDPFDVEKKNVIVIVVADGECVYTLTAWNVNICFTPCCVKITVIETGNGGVLLVYCF